MEYGLVRTFFIAILYQVCTPVRGFDLTAPIYQFTVKDAKGKEVSLSKYKGKVVMIVNGASYCGLTNTNYAQMKNLFEKYNAQGFEVAVFPCNQFAGQEPDDAKTVKEFIKKLSSFEPDVYEKLNVNGPEEHPLYTYLKAHQSGTLTDHIKWNFTKFLIDRSGFPVRRYAPTTEPAAMEKDVIDLLNNRSEL